MTTVEALASGVPVLATRFGGPEVFVEEKCGMVVSPDDATALDDGLAGMLDRLESYDRREITCTERAFWIRGRRRRV